MIATIVCGVFILIFIAMTIIFFEEEKYVFFNLAAILILGLLLAISLVLGRSINKENTEIYLLEKEHIEYTLENKPSLYSIEQAEEYNREIQDGNNHWCRFNIEDRSAYLIDIDSYIKDGD